MKPRDLICETKVVTHLSTTVYFIEGMLTSLVDLMERADEHKWNATGRGNGYGVEFTRLFERVCDLSALLSDHRNYLDKELSLMLDSLESRN